MIIPPAEKVVYGAPVDNATGLATMRIDTGIATVQSTDAQITAVLGGT
jgi:hypothetical protein